MFTQTKMIAFDLMGVLFSEPHIVKNKLMNFLDKNTDYNFVKDYYSKYDCSQINEDEFWQAIHSKDYLKIKNDYLNSIILENNYYDTINYLKTKYKLGILSNLPKEFGQFFIKKYEFEKIFDLILISGFTKKLKPDLSSYKNLIKKSGVNPEEILFIDDRKSNLQPASSLNIKTILYFREAEKNKFKPDAIIYNLSELKNLSDFLQ